MSLEKAVSDFIEALKENKKKGTEPYDTQAEVKRIDGNVAWVHIPGGVDETPVQLTSSAKPGDVVQVRVGGGRAWLYGNQTSPPTDDTMADEAKDRADQAYAISDQAVKDAERASQAANEAVTSAVEAKEAATDAQATAESVQGIAVQAQTAANTAVTNAQTAITNAQTAIANAASAQTAANTANSILSDMEDAAEAANTSLTGIYADAETAKTNAQTAITNAQTALTNAQQAQASANDAKQSATNANAYASRALGNLASVQSVTETLNWITEHGTMTLTADQSLDPTHVYFVLDDTDGDYHVGQHYYSVVIEPNIDNISTYYELSIDQSLNNYVGTHLALDNDGLWLLPASAGTYRILISAGSSGSSYLPGMYIIDDTGSTVAKYMNHIIIGKENESHIYVDYHSMQMIDPNGNSYLYVSDLRDTNGEYNATDTFTGSGTTSRFNLSMSYTSVISVTIDGVEQTENVDYTRSGAYSFIFTTAPEKDAKISISYVTKSTLAKAYTFGIRYPGSRVAPMSFAEGYNTTASDNEAHAEGYNSRAIGQFTHAENWLTLASGQASHAEGYNTKASGSASHAENWLTFAKGQASHAEGYNTTASGEESHAEGVGTEASGDYSHAEGYNTVASEKESHAEGYDTTARGRASHAEGYSTMASGVGTHAEGYATTAVSGGHAEGYHTNAEGTYSHAQNEHTIASKASQTVLGTYNIEDASSTTTHPSALTGYGEYSVIIGNGTDDNNRSNALTVDWLGNVEAGGDITDGNGNILSNKADTANIPTATSDLTNDSGFIDSSALPTKLSELTNDSNFVSDDGNGNLTMSGDVTDGSGNVLSAKANTSSLSAVATSGDYDDLSNKPVIPDELADLSGDSTHRLVTDTEKSTWNNKTRVVLSSPTPTITANTSSSTGVPGCSITQKALSITGDGKVATLFMTVKKTTATAAGSNIFKGTLSNYKPNTTCFGAGYYSSSGVICQISYSGAITVRVFGAQVPANAEVSMSITYVMS